MSSPAVERFNVRDIRPAATWKDSAAPKDPNAHLTAKYAFIEGWRWPQDVDRWFSDHLSDLVNPVPRPIIHAPCGSSKLGDLRVDAHHPLAGLRGDLLSLPFKDGSVGTLISDPPWNWSLHERIDFAFEVARVVRPGGLLLWCAPWLPTFGHFKVETVAVAAPRVGLPRNARLLVKAWRREPGPKAGKTQKKASQKTRRARRAESLEVFSDE